MAVATYTPGMGAVIANGRTGRERDDDRAAVTDGELLQRAGAGDRDAFDVLYERYSRPVFGLALRRLGDRGRAEDALQ